MNSSRLVPSVVVAAVLLLGGAGCSKILNAPQFQTGTVTHVVICTLKDRTPAGQAAAKERMLATAREIRKLSGVYDVEVGNALPPGRPGDTGEFDIGVTVTFRDAAALTAYLSHPVHTKAVKEVVEPLAAKVQVYDFTNQEYQ